MDPVNQVGQTSGGSKRGLYIIIGILVLIVLGFLMRGSFSRSEIYGTSVDKNFDGSTTYKNDYATTTINGNKWPDNWPTDVSKYSGATITTAGSTNAQAGVEGSQVMFTTSDSAQAVLDFYKKELTSSGWTSSAPGKPITGSQVGGMIVLSVKKDKRNINIGITNADGQSKVTLMIFAMPDVKTGL